MQIATHSLSLQFHFYLWNCIADKCRAIFQDSINAKWNTFLPYSVCKFNWSGEKVLGLFQNQYLLLLLGLDGHCDNVIHFHLYQMGASSGHSHLFTSHLAMHGGFGFLHVAWHGEAHFFLIWPPGHAETRDFSSYWAPPASQAPIVSTFNTCDLRLYEASTLLFRLWCEKKIGIGAVIYLTVNRSYIFILWQVEVLFNT